MSSLSFTRITAIAALLSACAISPAWADDLIPEYALNRLDVQRFWKTSLPLQHGESVHRVVLLDDNLYILTDLNFVFAVHVNTGILRWSTAVADEAQTVRGPSHSDDYAVFTTPGAVKLFDRRTGDLAGEPRALSGVVIEAINDFVTISIGEAHGVRLGDLLNVYHPGAENELTREPIARLKITIVQPRLAKGRITRLKPRERTRSGDRVFADVVLPINQIDLPFAASSAAAADRHNIYLGAANLRLYSLDIMSGLVNWEILAPKTLSAMPVLAGDDLYFADQDGRVAACTKADRAKIWEFHTEGAVFAEPLVTDKIVYAASRDRSLYALDRATGERIWRQRFDNPLNETPSVAEGRLYQIVPEEGLFVLDAVSGKQLWHRPMGGQFLAQIGTDAYIFTRDAGHELLRVDAATGIRKDLLPLDQVDFAAASRPDQSLVLISRSGALACLRSRKSPWLKPEQLTSVLVNDMRLRAIAEARARGKAEEPPAAKPDIKTKPAWLTGEDDFLASRSTAKPSGGSGLVDIQPKGDKPAPADDKKDADKPEPKDSDDDADKDDSDDADSDDDATEGDDEGDDDKDKDDGDDEDEGDEEGDDNDNADDDDSEDNENDNADDGDDEGEDDGDDGDDEGEDDGDDEGEDAEEDDGQ